MKLKREKYDIALIIGNGFDLNLGLKTSYTDFVKSEDFIDLVRRNNQLSRYLNDVHNLKNWIDVEKELKNYSKINAEKNGSFFIEFKELSNALQTYLRTINNSYLTPQSRAYKLIYKIIKSNALIIDFNYTSTVSDIFEELEIDINSQDSNIEHIKIHGSVENDNIIFGVEDNANILSQHVFLKKSTHENFNPIDFSSAISNSDTFIVFGHSLGETDHMYFDDFFSNAVFRSSTKRQNMLFYHYGEQSYYDIFAQIDKLTSRRITKLKQLNNLKTIDTKL